MEVEKKRELSNIRRLQSLKAKKQGRNIQAEQIKASLRNLDSNEGVLNKKTIFQSDDSDDDKACLEEERNNKKNTDGSTKMSLFPSDSEEDGDGIDHFQIKSKFQGLKDPQLLEETCDQRFQLNSIFMEDAGTEDQDVESSDEKIEKQKNMEILESVLGFQLPKNDIEPSAAKKKKKYVHFNPEDESTWKYLRKTEPKSDKIVKKEVTTAVHEPQVSPLRYFEVSTDLKSVLEGASSEEFRLSEMFKFNKRQDETNDQELRAFDTFQNHTLPLDDQSSMKGKKMTVGNVDTSNILKHAEISKNSGNEQYRKFFIMPGDARLQGGVDFFKREKSMEEIRENFYRTREAVLEILKKKHRRGYKPPFINRDNRSQYPKRLKLASSSYMVKNKR